MEPTLITLKALAEAGKVKALINGLAQIDLARLNEAESIAFAQLTRKAGLPRKGAAVLFPLMNVKPVSAALRVAYGWCLFDLGFSAQILDLFKDASTHSREMNHLLGQVHLRNWNIREAIPYLETFLASTENNNNEILDAARGLLSCYRLAKIDENCKSLLNRVAFPEEDKQEERLFQVLRQNPDPQVTESVLARIKELAKKGKIEKAREFYYYLARYSNNEALLTSLYFGSPHEAFRKIVLRSIKDPSGFSETYTWARESDAQHCFDVLNGIDSEKSGASLNPGQNLQRFLTLLSSEHYFSMPPGYLIEKLFPNTSFHPVQSQARLHQIVKRVRGWIRKNELPLKIIERNGRYKLEVGANYAIRLHRKLGESMNHTKLFARTANRLPEIPFTVSDAADRLDVSPRFARKLLERALSEGWIKTVAEQRPVKFALVRSSNTDDGQPL